MGPIRNKIDNSAQWLLDSIKENPLTMKVADLGGLLYEVKEGQLFSCKNLAEGRGYLFLDTLKAALDKRYDRIASDLIRAGLPVSDHCRDLAIRFNLRDVVLSIIRKAKCLDYPSIRRILQYNLIEEDEELMQALFQREDVKSDMYGRMLQEFCLAGKREFADFLLKQIHTSSPFLPPPLHRAVIAGDWSRVKRHLEDVAYVWPLTGQTATQLAGAFGQSVLVNELMLAQVDRKLSVGGFEFGVNSALLSSRSEYFRALFERFKERAQELIAIVDVPVAEFREILEYLYTGELAVTAENFAAFAHLADRFAITGVGEKLSQWLENNADLKEELAEELVEMVARLSTLPAPPSSTPLHFEDTPEPVSPLSTTEEELLEKLVSKKPINIPQELALACKNSWAAAITLAVQNGHVEVLYILLLDAMNEKDIPLAKLLLDRGVPVLDRLVCSEGGDMEGMTLLHCALNKRLWALVDPILDHIPAKSKKDFINKRCEQISDNLEEDNTCFTALDMVCAVRYHPCEDKEGVPDSVVKRIISEGAIVDRDSVHHALDHMNARALRCMLASLPEDKRKSLVNEKNDEGDACLHTLMHTVKEETYDGMWEMYSTVTLGKQMIDALLDAGADLSIKDSEGRTPFALAMEIAEKDDDLSFLPGKLLQRLPTEKKQQVLDLIGA